MKEEDAVRLDIYLPKAWHDWLINVKERQFAGSWGRSIRPLVEKTGLSN